MDAIQRREILQPVVNPGGGRDYVVTLREPLVLEGQGGLMQVTLRYVPDRQLLEPANFTTYLGRLAPVPWDTLEAAAVAILDDIANELVPRWAQVTLRGTAPGEAPSSHEISLEESQPGWRNDDLLYRLPPV
jgi:7-cyano-7-deazaguanine reductase